MENTEAFCIGLGVLIIMWMVVDGQKTKVYRFHRPGCGYCKRSQKEWEEFKSNCMFRMISAVDINMDEANEEEQEMFAEMGGSGVPHVAMADSDGNNWVHQGDRTAEGYMRWVNNPSVGGFATSLEIPDMRDGSYGTMEY
jgi:glutaredoxin